MNFAAWQTAVSAQGCERPTVETRPDHFRYSCSVPHSPQRVRLDGSPIRCSTRLHFRVSSGKVKVTIEWSPFLTRAAPMVKFEEGRRVEDVIQDLKAALGGKGAD